MPIPHIHVSYSVKTWNKNNLIDRIKKLKKTLFAVSD